MPHGLRGVCHSLTHKKLRQSTNTGRERKQNLQPLCVIQPVRCAPQPDPQEADLGLAMSFVHNKGAGLVVTCCAQMPVVVRCSFVNVLRAKGKGAASFYHQRLSHLPLYPDFNEGPNVSITRLPIATNGARAPKGDKTYTQPLELGA